MVDRVVTYAVDGSVLGWCRDRSCGGLKTPDGVPEWAEGVADQQDGSRAPALALVAELVEARIDEGWFARPWRTTRIPDVEFPDRLTLDPPDRGRPRSTEHHSAQIMIEPEWCSPRRAHPEPG